MDRPPFRSTTEIASNPNLTPPGGVSPGANSATTLDLAWTPSDLSLATAVEVSYDQGATWSLQTTFDAGVSAGRVYHLAPDHVVFFRLSTVGSGGLSLPRVCLHPERRSTLSGQSRSRSRCAENHPDARHLCITTDSPAIQQKATAG